MAPYSELQEPVTPTYEPEENSDAKDMHHGISPSVVVPNVLPLPIPTDSPTEAIDAGERQPRRRRRVKSMPVNSEGAQDFFGPAARSSRRYERLGSAPQAFAPNKPDTFLLIQESESIEEADEEDAVEEPNQVARKEDVKAKADAFNAEVNATSPSSPSSSSKEPVLSNQADTACSCVIL